MLQKMPVNAVIEHQSGRGPPPPRLSYFPHKSLTWWCNGTEVKIEARLAPQNRLEWENFLLPEIQI
jgi:hypothetical protein